MPSCISCGAELKDSQKFCSRCGNPQFGDTPEIVWTGRMSLVKNPQLYRTYLIMLGIGIVFGILIALLTGSLSAVIVMVLIMLGLIGLFIIGSVLWEWVCGSGPEIEGIVNNEGVAHRVGDGTRSINRGSLLIGLLSALGGGRSGLSVLGGGILATSQEDNSIAWEDVRSVKVHPSKRLILLRDATYINGVVLYCTEENFDRVLDVIKKRIPREVTIS